MHGGVRIAQGFLVALDRFDEPHRRGIGPEVVGREMINLLRDLEVVELFPAP